MDGMGKPSGLAKRPGSSSYYFRQRWPKRYRRADTPHELWISLGTANYGEAIAKLDEARAKAQRQFRGDHPQCNELPIRPMTTLPPWPTEGDVPELHLDQALQIAQSFFQRALRELDAEAPVPSGVSRDQLEETRRELMDRLSSLSNQDPDDGVDYVSGAVTAELRRAGLKADPAGEAARLLWNYIRRAMAQLGAIRLARWGGDYGDTITDSIFHEDFSSRPGDALASASPPIGPSGSTSLDKELVDDWARERSVSAKGVDKHRAAARWFLDRVGEVAVEAITRSHVLTFKRKLIAEGVSAANANAKLSCLRTLFGFAVEGDLLEANPADRISVLDRDKDRRKRREFDEEALRALFGSPVYAADARPVQGRGEAAYWIPLLALYTGARLEEIAQLRPTDVCQVRYVDGHDQERMAWVIHITADDEDDLRLKNAASERQVPLHPALEGLGFIQFARAANQAGHKRLFPALRPNVYGRLGAKWGEWWSRYRRDVCGISDRRIVFHSFRHTFKYWARHAGMNKGVQRQIMGHSPEDTGEEYGPSGYSLHQLVEGMRLYRIPGLSLPPPPPYCR